MKTPEHDMRRVEIEAHRGANKKLTGHTVHAYHMPKSASKSGAFMEETHESTPFNITDHKAMMAHVAKLLGGAGVGAKAAGGSAKEENDEEESDD